MKKSSKNTAPGFNVWQTSTTGPALSTPSWMCCWIFCSCFASWPSAWGWCKTRLENRPMHQFQLTLRVPPTRTKQSQNLWHFLQRTHLPNLRSVKSGSKPVQRKHKPHQRPILKVPIFSTSMTSYFLTQTQTETAAKALLKKSKSLKSQSSVNCNLTVLLSIRTQKLLWQIFLLTNFLLPTND